MAVSPASEQTFFLSLPSAARHSLTVSIWYTPTRDPLPTCLLLGSGQKWLLTVFPLPTEEWSYIKISFLVLALWSPEKFDETQCCWVVASPDLSYPFGQPVGGSRKCDEWAEPKYATVKSAAAWIFTISSKVFLKVANRNSRTCQTREIK